MTTMNSLKRNKPSYGPVSKLPEWPHERYRAVNQYLKILQRTRAERSTTESTDHSPELGKARSAPR